MAITYELPPFLKGTKVKRQKYARWLHRRAQSHARRDSRRRKKNVPPSEYKQAIHRAVLDSKGHDFYTGELLEWCLIGKYDNDKAEREGLEYRRDLALLPTVDHENPEAQDPVFRICGMQTNDCKSNLTVGELKDWCKKFLKAQGREIISAGSS
ncbi:MAG: hypothetical protein OXI65_06940 [Acidobacteriota bacterium]|nr:hypothetical protein [Acidobacteriota bacterium]